MSDLGFDSDFGLHEIVAYAKGATGLTFELAKLDRRRFLQLTGVAGGGLMLGLYARPGEASTPDAQAGRSGHSELNAYLKIANGKIRILAPNPEIGQGVKTSLPMIVAEELDAAWSDVCVEQAPIDNRRYGRQFAGGSRSVASRWNGLRQVGAGARAMLVAAAAQRWNVPDRECTTADSHVLHAPSSRRASYFELAAEAARQPLPVADELRLKRRQDYRLLGRPIAGVDNRAIVTGEPLYGIDQKIPDMAYAAYEKGSATGARVKRANLDAIRRRPGVLDAFVIEGNGNPAELMPGVAIVARDTWTAFQAKQALEVEWDETRAAKDSWSAAVEKASALAGQDGTRTVADSGEVASAFESAAVNVESRYAYHFISHAQLEPQNCTAWVRDGLAEVWAPTQMPGLGVRSLANVLGLPPSQIRVHQTRAGGGFGRRLVNDAMAEAAAISARAGLPVKLTWTREDDMRHDFYRVGGFHSLKGAVDRDGRLTAWQNHFVTFSHDEKKPVVGGDLPGSEFPAGLVDHYRLTQTMLPWHTPCGSWRAPGASAFAFPVQSFVHELAVAARRDPLEFLLEILGEPRWFEPRNGWSLNTGRAAVVVKRAAKEAGWGRTLPDGQGLGLAFHFSHAGHFAHVAQVSVSADKRLRVHRVTVAGDVGPIVNRSGAEAQVQGSVIDGISAMAGQKVTHENGRVEQTNYHRYPLLRMSQAPEVDVHFVESENRPSGLGEPALPPVAPAVCNAIFEASGYRIRTLPISEEGFRV